MRSLVISSKSIWTGCRLTLFGIWCAVPGSLFLLGLSCRPFQCYSSLCQIQLVLQWPLKACLQGRTLMRAYSLPCRFQAQPFQSLETPRQGTASVALQRIPSTPCCRCKLQNLLPHSAMQLTTNFENSVISTSFRLTMLRYK